MSEAGHVAIMQPYLFPYLGYFQLLSRVNSFVFLDDVNFIKRGYINRNLIRLYGAPHRFSLPVRNQSQNRLIKDHFFTDEPDSVVTLLVSAYRRAPYFRQVMPLLESVLRQTDRRVSALTAASVMSVANYLGLATVFRFSSGIARDGPERGQGRIIEICQKIGALRYSNAIGGLELYDRDAFRRVGIALEFIRMRSDVAAEAQGFPAMANLSVIDALMLCPPEQVVDLLDKYEIV